jgi:hypothetical protein
MPRTPLPQEKVMADPVACWYSFTSPFQSREESPSQDPMLVDALLHYNLPGSQNLAYVPESARHAHTSGCDRACIQNSILEMITFPISDPPSPPQFAMTAPSVIPAIDENTAFVNMTRGMSSRSLQEGVIPSSPMSFVVVVSKPLPTLVLLSPA